MPVLGATERNTSGGTMPRCTLLGVDALGVPGGLRAPVTREVGIAGYLIELYNKGLNPYADLPSGIFGCA